MNFLSWSPHFETGLAVVDDQHHGLVDLVNEAAPSLARVGHTDLSGVNVLLDRLSHYAVVHFQDEEALMVDAGLAPAYVDRHRRTHQAFVQAVGTMRRQFLHSGQLSGPELLRFLSSWLSFHILSEDQCMARQIHAIRQGADAEQAWAAESTPSPTQAPQAVYVGALIDLFTVVNERNRALSDLNEQLAQAQADLARMNAELEVRVQERTLALQRSLEQLADTQRQLGQAEKMAAVGQLAAGVAHEINNPVGFVQGNLKVLGRYAHDMLARLDPPAQPNPAGPAPDGEAAHPPLDLAFIREDLPALLAESQQGLDRITQIVKALQVFAQPAAEGQQPIHLAALLADAWTQSGQALNRSALQRARSVAEPEWRLQPLLPLVGDRAQLAQALANVMVNARQAVEAGGGIEVAAGPLAADAGPGVWVEVRDTGEGIPAEVQARVFDPFFTTRPVGQGTGLGLSLAWEIVRRHGGRLSVHPGQPRGTTVRFELPSQPAASATATG